MDAVLAPLKRWPSQQVTSSSGMSRVSGPTRSTARPAEQDDGGRPVLLHRPHDVLEPAMAVAAEPDVSRLPPIGRRVGLIAGRAPARDQATRADFALHQTIFQLLLYCLNMDKQIATGIFECLSSGVRLDVYRRLVRRAPQGIVAGEIASVLDLPPANLSFHLKAMIHGGLVTAEQEGRFQRYRANLPLMVDLIAYLNAECCAGHPEQCVGSRIPSAEKTTLRHPPISTKARPAR